MAFFKLTPEQVSIVEYQLSIARHEGAPGRPGMVLAQIARNKNNPDEVCCEAFFIDHEAAKKVKLAVSGTKRGNSWQ